ncbi:MAG: prepilin-type N-terminal cleavage/methylation domain-containing protein [Candidatus Paceibacterota bacterium]
MESFTVLKPSNVPPRANKGFTLVEMLVVLAIISIISAIAVTGQSTFNQSLLLTNTAYTVALSAREAQSFGLSSRKFGNVTNAGYGVHFDRSLPSSYQLFADISNVSVAPSNCPASAGGPDVKYGNCVYDSSPADGLVEKFTFSRGFKVLSFCGKQTTSGTLYCSNSAPSNQLSTLDVVFIRPNTSAVISGTASGSSIKEFSCAIITLTDSTNVATKAIRISSLGEISIGQTVCP